MNIHFRQESPCHLYFNLEFKKRDNAEKNGDEMVDLLISVVFDALSDKYSIQGDHDWIVELDSSTEGIISIAAVWYAVYNLFCALFDMQYITSSYFLFGFVITGL